MTACRSPVRVDGPDFDLTEAQIFQALAAEVEVEGALVANPYTNWSEIDPALPDDPIQVFGPPPTSGTRDAFVELVMHRRLRKVRRRSPPSKKTDDGGSLRPHAPGRSVHRSRRERQHHRPAPAGRPNALGIFGYSFLYENTDTVKAVHDQRRRADVRDDRRRQLPRFPAAVLLHQERASRRDPRPRGVRHRVHLRGVVRPGRLPRRAWPDPASRRGSRDHPPGGGHERAPRPLQLIRASGPGRARPGPRTSFCQGSGGRNGRLHSPNDRRAFGGRLHRRHTRRPQVRRCGWGQCPFAAELSRGLRRDLGRRASARLCAPVAPVPEQRHRRPPGVELAGGTDRRRQPRPDQPLSLRDSQRRAGAHLRRAEPGDRRARPNATTAGRRWRGSRCSPSRWPSPRSAPGSPISGWRPASVPATMSSAHSQPS